jgi:hypothetical protein
MLKEKVEQLLDKLNKEHKQTASVKVYSNNVPISDKLAAIKKLPLGLRGAASLVYDALEGHADEKQEVYASQLTIANETGYSRCWVNFILSKLEEIGLINKIRRGLTKTNIYILTVKKSVVDIVKQLKELYIQIQKERKEKSKKINNMKRSKNSNFNNFEQRNYSDDELSELEAKLLGYDPS